MQPQTVDIGAKFHARLTNRDETQGDGRHNAVQFRNRYLAELDGHEAWKNRFDTFVIFDFQHVEKIAPSFANEAFAYFTKFAPLEQILKVIEFCNISRVKREIIQIELESGYEVKA